MLDGTTAPLVLADLMMSRNLALNSRKHIHVHIRGFTISAMCKEHKRRSKRGETLVDKDELIAMAQKEEGLLLKFEAEMRATGQARDPRQTDRADSPAPLEAPPRLHHPMVERIQHPSNLKDRLGTRVLYHEGPTSRAIVRR